MKIRGNTLRFLAAIDTARYAILLGSTNACQRKYYYGTKKRIFAQNCAELPCINRLGPAG
jgi:hypothetical protein